MAENVAPGPEFAGMGRAESGRVTKEHLRPVNLTDFAHSYPHELSGGMRQRVVIRALTSKPDLLLMDAPFVAMDARTHALLRKELLNIRRRHRTTMFFVTHSMAGAVFLADRIVVMAGRPGRVRAVPPADMPGSRGRADQTCASP